MDTPPTSTIQGRRIQWPVESAMAQNFSLPSSIMYYITMNPSTPKVYNKLIQTCKHFFERNPILVVALVTEKAICSNDKCYHYGRGKCCVKMDIKKITSKIWITHHLNLLQNTIPNFTALLQPKIYRCDVDILSIAGRIVEFEDFKFFALSAKDIRLLQTIIVFKNGCPVMLENILEAFPNIEEFQCFFENNYSMVSASTVKNMSKLKNLGNLKRFYLFNIPEVFQLDDLLNFIKDYYGMKIALRFAENISEHYKNQLDHLTDSLIESQLSNGIILYDGQNQEKTEILRKRVFK